MSTPPAVFIESLGWLIALMLAALLPGLPAMRRWNHTGWIVAFCATRLITTAQTLVGPEWASETRELAAILSGMLLWEFARRIWNDASARRISAVTHVLALESFALIAAANAAAGWTATTGWLLPVSILVATLPALLGGAAALLLWQCFDRRALRLAAIGLGLYGLGAAAGPVAVLGAVAPWLAAGGLAGICFTVPAARTRTALVWVGGLLVTLASGPLIVATSLRRIDAAQTIDLLARAQQAGAPLQGRTAARLEAQSVPTDEVQFALRDHLEKLRESDPLLRDATIWKLRGNRVLMLDLTGNGSGAFVDRREATAGEISQAAGLRPFLTRAGERIVAHGALKPSALETPVAWLALDYPETFWSVRREQARRNGIALLSVLAGFCAVGFVLTGRQAIEAAQSLALERAESADRAKSEFLAFLSHEMRTPLQTILGRAELLRREIPATIRHADVIENQGSHLLRLVNDLLDLGTIEAGKLKLHSAPFALRPLVAALEEIHSPAAAAKGLTLDLVIAPDLPETLLGDEARLRQILGNLLANAVKYTASGKVALHVSRDAAGASSPELVPLVFAVTDTGHGLPPEKIPQLFTLFKRLNPDDTFTREGTGVGLALVRRLCDLMGGTVAAANCNAGGAAFTVRLVFPRAEAAAAPAPVSPFEIPGNALRVLVAEDNDAAREFLAEAVAALGHQVATVRDGEAALAAGDTQIFDAIILDINLPGRDGIALARILSRRTPRPRLIACSAEVFAATREAAFAAGVDAFLEKPATLAALAGALTPAAPVPAGASLFERLRSPELVARARVALLHDIPVAVDALCSTHQTGDGPALQRQAHHLHATALLAGDHSLAELCRRLERAAVAGVTADLGGLIAAVARHGIGLELPEAKRPMHSGSSARADLLP